MQKNHNTCNNLPMTTKTLPEIIRATGVETFAKQYGFSERAVESWMRKERRPNRSNIIKLYKRSKGAIPLEMLLLTDSAKH